jgi:hypothetical protein
MLKVLSAVAFALTVSVAVPAMAETGNFGFFYIQNSPASGAGNPGFCKMAAHDALTQNNFISIGEDSNEVWGFTSDGNTLVYVSCAPYGANSQWAAVSVVAAGPVYSTTEYWRNTIRTAIQNVKWL